MSLSMIVDCAKISAVFILSIKNTDNIKELHICLAVNMWFGKVISGVPQQHAILWFFPVFAFHLWVAQMNTTLKERIVSLLLVSVVCK